MILDYEEQEVFDETPFNSSSVVKETRNFGNYISYKYNHV